MPTGIAHLVVRPPAALEPVLVNVITHSLLSHLLMPQWLAQGLAKAMQAVLWQPPRAEPDTLHQLTTWWTPASIQSFWSGATFLDPGWRSPSFALAYLLVQELARDYPRLVQFANAARYEDAGLAASLAIYGKSLGELPVGVLGPGDWAPKPETWSDPT